MNRARHLYQIFVVDGRLVNYGQQVARMDQSIVLYDHLFLILKIRNRVFVPIGVRATYPFSLFVQDTAVGGDIF